MGTLQGLRRSLHISPSLCLIMPNVNHQNEEHRWQLPDKQPWPGRHNHRAQMWSPGATSVYKQIILLRKEPCLAIAIQLPSKLSAMIYPLAAQNTHMLAYSHTYLSLSVSKKKKKTHHNAWFNQTSHNGNRRQPKSFPVTALRGETLSFKSMTSDLRPFILSYHNPISVFFSLWTTRWI